MYNMYIEPRQKGGSCIEFSQKKTSNRNRKFCKASGGRFLLCRQNDDYQSTSG